jgi:signal transduction histidine kinase
VPNVRRGLAALGPPLIVALLGVLTVLGVRRERFETEWVMHTQAVRVAISTVFTSLRDAEAGVRGYVLTGDTASLRAYNAQLPLAGRWVDSLRVITSDNPRQGARLPVLDTLVRLKESEMTRVVQLMQGGRRDEAVTAIAANQRSKIVNRIRSLLGEMDADESVLLQERLRNVERQRRSVIIVVVTGTIVATALALLALQILARSARQLELQRAEVAASRDRLLDAAEQLEARTHLAEEANRAKAQFLTTMSHELRTPLNAIDGYASLLEMGVRGPVTEAQAQDLARIRRSQRHLLALVNDVLNFARVEAGRIEWEIRDVLLEDVLQAVEAVLLPQIESKQIRYRRSECDSGLTVRADPEKLRQILVNLVGNAWKFTPAGGEISITCTSDDRLVHIRVTDTGRGIPPEKLATIFDPFVQVDRHLTPESQQGVGLGLAISRDLARGMQGELEVSSAPQVVSSFTLAVPRASATASHEPVATTTTYSRS